MIGAAGADPGRLVVHSHIYWVWEDSRHARIKDRCCGIFGVQRHTGQGEAEVTLQKAVAIRNGIALKSRIRKWLARVISNLPQ